MKYSFLLMFSATVLICAGCNSRSKAPVSRSMTIAEVKPPNEEASTDEKELLAAPDDNKYTAAVPISQKIIKNGRLSFATSDFDACRSRIVDTVKKYGGYIANENQANGRLQLRNELEIKVPAAVFEQCLEALTGGASRIDEKSITSQDITAEYVDIDARMKARLAVEQRYLQILQQAKKVEDILAVEAQLKTIREDIEAAKGRLQYMDHHVAYSSIQLTYYQTLANSDPQAPGFFRQSWLSLQEGWNGILSFALGILTVWPLLLGIVFLVIFIRRGIRKWKLKKAIAQTPTNVNL